MLRRQPGREEKLVPVAGEDAAAIAREFVGEILGVADTEDLRTRVVAQAPGRKGDRGQVRLQMARRQADDQPADLPSRTAASFAAISSTCQFIANGVRGLSSRNARAAKLAKSWRNRAAHSPHAASPATAAPASSLRSS